MRKTNDIITYVIASFVAVAFLIVSSCGDEQVTYNSLHYSPEDYVGRACNSPENLSVYMRI